MRSVCAKRFFHGGHDEGLVWRYCRTWTPEGSLRDSGPLVAPREQAISAVATASRTGPARSGAWHDAFAAKGQVRLEAGLRTKARPASGIVKLPCQRISCYDRHVVI